MELPTKSADPFPLDQPPSSLTLAAHPRRGFRPLQPGFPHPIGSVRIDCQSRSCATLWLLDWARLVGRRGYNASGRRSFLVQDMAPAMWRRDCGGGCAAADGAGSQRGRRRLCRRTGVKILLHDSCVHGYATQAPAATAPRRSASRPARVTAASGAAGASPNAPHAAGPEFSADWCKT